MYQVCEPLSVLTNTEEAQELFERVKGTWGLMWVEKTWNLWLWCSLWIQGINHWKDVTDFLSEWVQRVERHKKAKGVSKAANKSGGK